MVVEFDGSRGIEDDDVGLFRRLFACSTRARATYKIRTSKHIYISHHLIATEKTQASVNEYRLAQGNTGAVL